MSAVVERRTPIVRAVLAQARMELTLALRSAESLLVTLGIPLGILIAFSLVDALPGGGRDRVPDLVAGVLGVSVVASGLVSLAIQTGFERKYGVLKLLGGSPLPRAGLLAAKVLAVLGTLVVQAALVTLVARVGFDWQPTGSVVAVLLAVVLGSAAFGSIGMLLAGTLRAEGTLAVSNAVFLAATALGGLVVPRADLPAALAAVDRWLPSGALGDALRAGFGSQIDGTALAVLAAWALLAALAASRTFRWEP